MGVVGCKLYGAQHESLSNAHAMRHMCVAVSVQCLNNIIDVTAGNNMGMPWWW